MNNNLPQRNNNAQEDGWSIGRFLHYGTLPLIRYFDFKGRSCREEYFSFFGFMVICMFIVGFIMGFSAESLPFLSDIMVILFGLIYLGSIIPSFSVMVRRLHDTDHNWWWAFVPFANVYFIFVAGDKGPNRFGDATT